MFEELGVDHLQESHRVLFQLMMSKLKTKADHPGVINKAIRSEQKVIYKYKDIEDCLVKGLATDDLLNRMLSTETMKAVFAVAQKAREAKPKTGTGKKKVRISDSHTKSPNKKGKV